MSNSTNAKLLNIRLIGDEVLRQVAKDVTKFDAELHSFLEDLTHTMYITDGVGLAAPQVGVSKRIFVIDYEWSEEDGRKNPQVYINPKITSEEGSDINEEGCLSLPEVYDKIRRPDSITITAQDKTGKSFTKKFEGFPAVVFQHENDHLDGTLFVDHLSKLKLMIHKPKINKIKSTTDEKGQNIQER
ncbi:MAG: peptide deformylase [Candidatus Cloacimonetes bacterium 4572_65]|nr:MAG: peptide deformylase [Candidatus Cloacimonetes bacterium 4572_65]